MTVTANRSLCPIGGRIAGMRQGSCVLRLVATAGCVAVVLSACSREPDDQAATDMPSADAGQASTAPALDPDGVATAATSPTPGTQQSEPFAPESPTAQPRASVSVPIGFIDGGELEMAVASVEVVGELMRVGITFNASLPPEAPSVAIGAVLAASETAPATGFSPEVIDPVNLKAYEAVVGAIPNGTTVNIQDGVPQTLIFYYAAPQDDVETLDIIVSSQVPTLSDIPFEQ
jgi:hypothetical protein